MPTLVRWRRSGRRRVGDGDILIYGCNTGRGGAGQAFLEALADLTGRASRGLRIRSAVG